MTPKQKRQVLQDAMLDFAYLHMEHGDDLDAHAFTARFKGGRLLVEVSNVNAFMADPRLKNSLAQQMKSRVQEPDVSLVGFVSEIWRAEMSVEDYQPDQSISQRPDKQEGLLILIYDKASDYQWLYNIDRAHNTLTLDEELALGDGRFSRGGRHA